MREAPPHTRLTVGADLLYLTISMRSTFKSTCTALTFQVSDEYLGCPACVLKKAGDQHPDVADVETSWPPWPPHVISSTKTKCMDQER